MRLEVVKIFDEVEVYDNFVCFKCGNCHELCNCCDEEFEENNDYQE